MLNWLIKKPATLKISHKKFETLKIIKILKSKEDLLEIIEFSREFTYLHNGDWNIESSYQLDELPIDFIIDIHNSFPLNIKVEHEEIEKLLEEKSFILEKTKRQFVINELKKYENIISFEEYENEVKEQNMLEALALEDEETKEQEIADMVDANEVLENHVINSNITGHALFLYIPEEKNIKLYEFHNFEDLYKMFAVVVNSVPKEHYKYSISEELITLEEYLQFLNLFGEFNNIQKCQSVKELNEWIISGRKLMAFDHHLSEQNV